MVTVPQGTRPRGRAAWELNCSLTKASDPHQPLTCLGATAGGWGQDKGAQDRPESSWKAALPDPEGAEPARQASRPGTDSPPSEGHEGVASVQRGNGNVPSSFPLPGVREAAVHNPEILG